MIRSFDPEVMKAAFAPHPQYHDDQLDYKTWLDDRRNVMYALDNGDIGLATFEYPGVYNVHWFFNNTKGRAAINLAREMLDKLFEDHDVKIIRGITPMDVKAARFLAKYVGMKSYGTVHTENGECELMLMTKDEFYQGKN